MVNGTSSAMNGSIYCATFGVLMKWTFLLWYINNIREKALYLLKQIKNLSLV